MGSDIMCLYTACKNSQFYKLYLIILFTIASIMKLEAFTLIINCKSKQVMLKTFALTKINPRSIHFLHIIQDIIAMNNHVSFIIILSKGKHIISCLSSK